MNSLTPTLGHTPRQACPPSAAHRCHCACSAPLPLCPEYNPKLWTPPWTHPDMWALPTLPSPEFTPPWVTHQLQWPGLGLFEGGCGQMPAEVQCWGTGGSRAALLGLPGKPHRVNNQPLCSPGGWKGRLLGPCAVLGASQPVSVSVHVSCVLSGQLLPCFYGLLSFSACSLEPFLCVFIPLPFSVYLSLSLLVSFCLFLCVLPLHLSSAMHTHLTPCSSALCIPDGGASHQFIFQYLLVLPLISAS